MKTKTAIKGRLKFYQSWLKADIEHKDWQAANDDETAIKILEWVLEDSEDK